MARLSHLEANIISKGNVLWFKAMSISNEPYRYIYDIIPLLFMSICGYGPKICPY